MDIRTSMTQIPMLQEASSTLIDRLLPYTYEKACKRGEHVFLDRSVTQNIYFLLSGSVSFYKLGLNEEKRVIRMAKTKDILNLDAIDGGKTSCFCECLTSVTMLMIDKEALLKVAQSDYRFMMALFGCMSQSIRQLHHQLKNHISAIRLDKRIAAKLWKLARDHGEKGPQGVTINMPLSITYLADLLGAKRESVSRSIKLLYEQKLIISEGKCFIVLDAKRLCEYASKV